MTSGSEDPRIVKALGGFVALLTAVILPGCALSDDYHIEHGLDGSTGTGSDGSSGGALNLSSSISTEASSADSSGGSGGDQSSTAGATAVGGGGTTDGSADSASTDSGGSGGTGSEAADAAGSGGTAGTGGTAGAGTGGNGGADACQEDCNAGRACPGGTRCEAGWVETSTPPGGFSPREQAAYVSIGNQLFIWGGLNESGTALDSGALYDPRTDSWTTVSTEDPPSPRSNATAVWTGAEVVVWGGFDPGTDQALDDGGIYDPVDDVWIPMAAASVARSAPVATYGQDHVMFWGGWDDNGEPVAGIILYSPDTDNWQADDAINDPGALNDAAAAGGQQTFWLFGGRDESNMASGDGAYYSLNSFDWRDLSSSPLSDRWGAFGAFANLGFAVWGGRDLDRVFDDGARYDLGGGFGSNWADLDTQDAPSARYRSHRESGWAMTNGSDVIIIGGLDDPDSYLQDGGIYSPSSFGPSGPGGGNWTAIEAWPGSASHAFGAVDAAAGELVVWGGRDGSSLTNTGVRYLLP